MDTLSALLTLLAVLALALPASCEPVDTETVILQRSLTSMGDTARLQHALARARRGEKVVVGVIGGSITAGALASSAENRWGNRVAAWWRQTFPEAEIVFVNAGIGATGSNIGAHRVQQHLLSHQPDFVVAEFAVNDPNTELAAETLEGMTRQILKSPKRPAMMLLFTMHKNGGNAQEWHGKVGRHYGLPMVSFRDALWPEIEADRIKWEDVEGDMVHPNDRGHKYCADFVCQVLEKTLANLPADGQLAKIAAVPSPLLSDTFEHTVIRNADNTLPLRADGWTVMEAGPFGKRWQADKPGSVLEIEVEGTAIGLVFHRIKRDMGIAQAQVDDREPVKMNAWFNADWGGYSAWELVARDLAPGKHRLTVTLLDEKAEESNGHRFEIQAVMCAGLRAAPPTKE